MFPEIARDDVFRLETKRLWLRWPRESDAPAIAALAGEWDVARRTPAIPRPCGPDDSDRFIAEARAANAGGIALRLALTLKNFPRKFVGMIGVEPGDHGPQLGFWLGRPFWGRGLMSEATAALTDVFFRVTEGEKLHAFVAADHEASQAVLRKTGFSEAERPEAVASRHAGAPVAKLSLRRSDWEAPAAKRLRPAFASDRALA